jgi:ubiquinone/menaquinone biosynthesis C-methylase UbiE
MPVFLYESDRITHHGNGIYTPPAPPKAAYSEEAHAYDSRTMPFHQWRHQLVNLLPLRPGDVVIDVGCGTGLCFPLLQQRIGRRGHIIGVDMAPDMLELARQRVADNGWRNVTLLQSPVEDANLPMVADHALFCAVHDVMQSERALRNVLAKLRPGGSVAAGGGKWAPPWAFALNLFVLNTHAPYVRDFAGFSQPWTVLSRFLSDIRVYEVAMGGGYLALGHLPDIGSVVDRDAEQADQDAVRLDAPAA